jgi:hypothetical protein
MEEDEEREDMCTRPVSWGCGRLGTGEDPCTSDVDAMVLPQWWRGWLTLEKVPWGVNGGFPRKKQTDDPRRMAVKV